jgi:cob(I)alamin adenosyltransferase
MKIYTRTGDEGFTTRYDGTKVKKDDPIIILVAKIDSLLATLDTAHISINDENIRKIIDNTQKKLWQTAGEISLGSKGKKVVDVITQKDIDDMEKVIDKYENKNNFFIRFRKDSSTRLNEARIRCRELEVEMTKFLRQKKVRREVYMYVNRLSDLLYVLANYLN